MCNSCTTRNWGFARFCKLFFVYQAICWRWTAGLLQCHIRVIRVTRIATVEFKEDYGTEPSRYCLQTSPVRLRFDKVCEVAKQRCGQSNAAKISWTLGVLGAWSHDCDDCANSLQLLAIFGPSITFRAQSIAA